jgi:hypothetical protein
MSTLAAHRAEYEASQQGNPSGSAVAMGSEGDMVRCIMADDWALGEAVVWPRMGCCLLGSRQRAVLWRWM